MKLLNIRILQKCYNPPWNFRNFILSRKQTREWNIKDRFYLHSPHLCEGGGLQQKQNLVPFNSQIAYVETLNCHL